MESPDFLAFKYFQTRLPNMPQTDQDAIGNEVGSSNSVAEWKLMNRRKHDLRHTKPFICTVPGCLRTDGFSTTNDLERHTKSKHPSAMPETAMTKKFRCLVPGCKSKEKSWPRLDNFRSHLKRVHGNQEDEDLEDLIRR